ncbi:hypothetical protein ACFWQC_21855, partial [Nocardioides sp. NPDC058538]|uniref:hypothetical protein n=1 Tax=Nocardioides sp. NPDC058538 TaxID=3346542 RepID=UPI0036467D1B
PTVSLHDVMLLPPRTRSVASRRASYTKIPTDPYAPKLNTFTTRDMYNGALADMGLSMDPFTSNRYAFGSGNPISGIELDGHRAVDTNGNELPAPNPWQKGHDGAVEASAEAAEEWAAENGYEGVVTTDISANGGHNASNKVKGGSQKGNGNDGYADLIFWGTGEDEGTIFVWEIKHAGGKAEEDGPADLERYVRGLQEMYPNATVEAGPGVAAKNYEWADEEHGRTWSKEGAEGIRLWAFNDRPGPAPRSRPNRRPNEYDLVTPSVTTPDPFIPARPGVKPKGGKPGLFSIIDFASEWHDVMFDPNYCNGVTIACPEVL